ncbi:spore coat protein U domain-containing protein [Salinisphaera sp. USBA-960]|uniref:Csu type fimbrial protein n=1 Tax=Salinisphaera orenii TaxID=856731 RepID=UPI000DBE96E6|nr:spore coat protein U domain-containing protein [Salifodinibacter halophilus]NNC25719.1 spore coat protein U domain-containing protein [Salifodinibacter halophilus]
MSNHLKLPAVLIVAASSAYAVSALAANDTTTLNVFAQVNPSCTISATDLRFGKYSPNNSDATTAETVISPSCTEGTEYEIGLDAGENGGNSDATSRAMHVNGNYLSYELYTSEARDTIWQDIDSENTVTGTASDTPEGDTHTVYGKIPAGQFVPTGQYSDAVNVTISF